MPKSLVHKRTFPPNSTETSPVFQNSSTIINRQDIVDVHTTDSSNSKLKHQVSLPVRSHSSCDERMSLVSIVDNEYLYDSGSSLQLKSIKEDIITQPTSPFLSGYYSLHREHSSSHKIQRSNSDSKFGYKTLQEDSGITADDSEEINNAAGERANSPELNDFVEQMYVESLKNDALNGDSKIDKKMSPKGTAASMFFNRLISDSGQIITGKLFVD